MLKAQKFQNTGPAPPFICSHSSEDAAKPVQRQTVQLSAYALQAHVECSQQSQEKCPREVRVRGGSGQHNAATICLSELCPGPLQTRWISTPLTWQEAKPPLRVLLDKLQEVVVVWVGGNCNGQHRHAKHSPLPCENPPPFQTPEHSVSKRFRVYTHHSGTNTASVHFPRGMHTLAILTTENSMVSA